MTKNIPLQGYRYDGYENYHERVYKAFRNKRSEGLCKWYSVVLLKYYATRHFSYAWNDEVCGVCYENGIDAY